MQGNAELISIASNDSIWNSDSEEEDEDDDERHPMVGHIREGAICRPDSRAEEGENNFSYSNGEEAILI